MKHDLERQCRDLLRKQRNSKLRQCDRIQELIQSMLFYLNKTHPHVSPGQLEQFICVYLVFMLNNPGWFSTFAFCVLSRRVTWQVKYSTQTSPPQLTTVSFNCLVSVSGCFFSFYKKKIKKIVMSGRFSLFKVFPHERIAFWIILFSIVFHLVYS